MYETGVYFGLKDKIRVCVAMHLRSRETCTKYAPNDHNLCAGSSLRRGAVYQRCSDGQRDKIRKQHRSSRTQRRHALTIPPPMSPCICCCTIFEVG